MPRDRRDAASSPATPLSASPSAQTSANVAAPRGRTGRAAPGESVDSTGWARTSFSGQFRRTQLLALEAFERSWEAGLTRSYLVLPPGSGKTVLGLEIARRLQRPTLCLGPNTAGLSRMGIIAVSWSAPATLSRRASPTPSMSAWRRCRHRATSYRGWYDRHDGDREHGSAGCSHRRQSCTMPYRRRSQAHVRWRLSPPHGRGS